MSKGAEADELYVISDLHFGGKDPARRLFRPEADERLGGLLDLLALRCKQQPGRRILLVLAGDVFDWLIADSVEPEHIAQAPQPLLRPTESAVDNVRAFKKQNPTTYKAFQKLLKKPNIQLVTLLGNHDLELADPVVWAAWAEQLAPAQADRARMKALVPDAGGVVCQVGSAGVRLVHGHQLDPWNKVDLDNLRDAISATESERGKRFKANAGTRLVVQAMNQLEARCGYSFLSVLKPEEDLVCMIATLLGSGEDRRLLGTLLPAGVSAFGRRLWGSLDGDAGAAGEVSRDERERSLADWTVPTATELLEQAQLDLTEGMTPRKLLDQHEGTLGLAGYIMDWLLRVPKPRALREAFRDWVGDNRCFSLTHQNNVDRALGQRFAELRYKEDFLVAGHTHLARAVEREDGGFYLNSGTWIPLLKLSKAQLADDDAFRPVYKSLVEDAKQKGGLAALEKDGLLWFRPTVVRIVCESGNTVGEVCEVQRDGQQPAKVWLKPLGDGVPFVVKGPR